MQSKKKRGRPCTVWVPKQVQMLKNIRPTSNDKDVAIKLKFSVSAIQNASFKFKVKKKNHYWDYSEERFIEKNWNVMTAKEIADHLKRTRWAVINKYRELTGLR